MSDTHMAATPRACSSTPAATSTCCAISAAARAPSAITRWPRAAAPRASLTCLCPTPTGTPTLAFHALSRVHFPHALGPHHGLSVLHAGLHPRQQDHDLRLPRLAGGGDQAPAGRAV